MNLNAFQLSTREFLKTGCLMAGGFLFSHALPAKSPT